ncbi:MAG: hypothetical protein RIQ93_3499 [Verrucomicrobiota bacterium]
MLLGATGSIGQNTLRVISAHPDRLELVGIAARGNWAQLAAIARTFNVKDVAIYDEASLSEAKANPSAFPEGTRLLGGPGGMMELAQLPQADVVLIAVVGTTGLEPALAALRGGKDLALASKEILVLAGKFIIAEARKHGAKLLPVDSEHNAVFQCLEGHGDESVSRVVLTASGGAFRDWPAADLQRVRPEDAIKHPNWSMGPKISVDSATLANKGLELIEAQWLFGLRPAQCAAVLHPQSVVHCLVEFTDGSMLAQLSPPSMTFPIQHALLYPARVPGVESGLDFNRLVGLEFRPVEEARYPMFRLAQETMVAGGVAPAMYNAANEVAVAAFLSEKIPFLAIPDVVGHTLSKLNNFEPVDLPSVLDVDAQSRRTAADRVRSLAS